MRLRIHTFGAIVFAKVWDSCTVKGDELLGDLRPRGQHRKKSLEIQDFIY